MIFVHLRPENGKFIDRKTGEELGWMNPYGYRVIRVNLRTMTAHRLAFVYMTGSAPPEQVDHINRDRDDNRWSNLRLASHTDNMRNRTITKLSDSLVTEIRKRYVPHCGTNGGRAMAREYGLHHDTVAKILRGQLWT